MNSNGINGTSNGTSKGTPNGSKTHSPPPITRELAQFISTLEYTSIPTPLITHLKTLLLDYLGVALYGAQNTSSSTPFLKAINAINSSGNSTVLTHGSDFQPQYAMLLNGAYAHTLDFDDTHLEGVVHPGVTVITAALTTAETLKSTSKQLLTSIAAGYEVVCRLGTAIGASGYAKGFHNTSTCGIFGAIAAISSLKGLKREVIENAFGIGISRTGGSMQFLVNGAWNKRLHPGFAAHDAFLAVTFAKAGVVGAVNAIEGEHGLLKGFGTVSQLDSILEGLGETWVCKDTAIKPYPACRLTHGAIDLASTLRLSSSQTVKALHLSLSPLSYKIVGIRAPNKLHPENAVDAQFSAFYQTAATWLDGSASGWKIYDRLQDRDVAELSERVFVVANKGLGDLQTSLEVLYEDGTREVRTCDAPLGEVSNPLSEKHIRQKYFSLAVPVLGIERAEILAGLVGEIEERIASELMVLVTSL